MANLTPTQWVEMGISQGICRALANTTRTKFGGARVSLADFNLEILSSSGEQTEKIPLSSARGQPVGLIFGSYTDPFREQAGRLKEIYEDLKNDAEFCVYIKEAHPLDGWVIPSNTDGGIIYGSPGTDARAAIATVCMMRYHFPFRMVWTL